MEFYELCETGKAQQWLVKELSSTDVHEDVFVMPVADVPLGSLAWKTVVSAGGKWVTSASPGGRNSLSIPIHKVTVGTSA